MKTLNTILLFGYIGAVPAITAGYSISQVEWWLYCAPFWILLGWRDLIDNN